MSDPQALHAELMAYDEADVILSPLPFLNAVKAVLEIHRLCAACGLSANWPCQTVKVISSALGVTTDG